MNTRTESGIKTKEKKLLTALLLNIALAYAILFVCRIIFIAMNSSLYADALAHDSLWTMAKGALLFDTSAVCYLNALYLLCLLLPLH